MITVRCADAPATRELGAALGRHLRAGDLVLLHGDLGAGKTTFTQGLARGLGVAGRVTSPTFIVARVHESDGAGPDLVHVDAYRVEDDLDLETLDLDSSLEGAVTVVEWGAGKVEALSDSRLEITFGVEEPSDLKKLEDWSQPAQEARVVTFVPIGKDWGRRLQVLRDEASGPGRQVS